MAVYVINTYFYRNVLLLTQVIPTSDEFKLHFREGMFNKPNTIGFIHVSQYLLTIYDAEHFQKYIQWPVTCRKSEVKYRNSVKDYLNLIAKENPDMNFPPILTSFLVRAHGQKLNIIMWKLSMVTLRTYIKRNFDPNIFYAPHLGSTNELVKTTLQELNKDITSNILSHHRNITKMKETFSIIQSEEKAAWHKVKGEIFEVKQSVINLTARAPVDKSIKICLIDIDNTEIIESWKKHITENLLYIRKNNKFFKEVQILSNEITNMVSSIINGTEILDAHKLGKIRSSPISLLPLSTNIQYLLHNLYINDKLVLHNFLALLNFLLCQAYQCLKKNELKDLSKCLLQIEASQKDITSGIKSFQSLTKSIESISTNLKLHSDPKKMNETFEENIFAFEENSIFYSSPPIKINTNCCEEGNDVLKRLTVTPIEGAHKSLFSRYKRQHGITNVPISQLRNNLLVVRTNFDDTLSLNNSDKISQTYSHLPKTNSLSTKHVGKYSRLFVSYAKKACDKGNCSISSVPDCIKANSTALASIEEPHNTSQFNLRSRTKSFFDLREVITPVKLINTISQLKSQCIFEESNNLHIDQQCNSSNEIEKNSTNANTKDNISVNNVKDTTNRRRSISDLVQRYKKVLENSKESTKYDI